MGRTTHPYSLTYRAFSAHLLVFSFLCVWLGLSAFHPLITLDVIVVIRTIPSASLECSGLLLPSLKLRSTMPDRW